MNGKSPSGPADLSGPAPAHLRRNVPGLYIPQPKYRPGDQPDFSEFRLPAAGETPLPPMDIKAEESMPYASGLVRVLDDGGKAVGPWAAAIDPGVLRQGLANMVTTRLYDERMALVQRQGKASFYMKCTGEEAVSIAQAMALRPDDMFFPTYRQQGLLIARGRPLVEMMCHCLSNTGDNLKGRQMPVFYSWRDGNFFSISGNLGTQFSQAVGWAMAAAYKGEDSVASAWVGEGATAEADVHYAMTFATVYRAPVLLNIVNNQWAISSFQGIAGGETSTFAERGLGYGIPGIRVDGNDFLAVYAATQWAAARARQGYGATVLELFTYRVDAHSTSDDPTKYRPKDEATRWPLGDPINRLRRHLTVAGEWSDASHEKLVSETEAAVREDFARAESMGTLDSGPKLDPKTMFDDVYKDQPLHLRRQRQQLGY